MSPSIPLLQPQELEVYYILPALRRELANTMKQQGKSQKDIAALLGVSEAAVSQYISAKRGADVDFTPELQANIKDAATRITDSITFIKETQQLANKVWKQRFICNVCHDQNGSAIPKGCAVCFE
jgi:predicted transcriptional regulator